MGFTKEQQLAIDIENSNVIVSAGAGSGKTAVLTERVIRKLRDGIDVDRLLVLTFTNEAANEMKSRIRKAIIKNKLDRQLGLIESAYITTFDSFALSIVKKYHYLLNISNNIGIVDSNIITIYKYKVLDSIFEEMYGTVEFDKLINDFCLKDDKSIKNFIIMVSSKLELLINKEEYLDNYIDNFYSDNYIDGLIYQYENVIGNKILELRNIYEELLSYIDDNLINKLDSWFDKLFNGNSYNDYILFKNIPSVRITLNDDIGKNIRDLLKKKLDEIKELLRFDSLEEIRQSIYDTLPYVRVIIDIIRKLDREVSLYKNKNEIYEFNDIAHMAISVVKDNLDVRLELRDYFNEIMVDEYQDTSSIQEEFINLISNNNVYMVGDIKQSIYRFRNANPYIFQDKYDRYSNGNDGVKIDLLKNFRSRSETLFNINEIFNLIMDNDIGNANYIESHNMVYGNTLYDNEDTKENNYLEIYNYDNEDKEFTSEEKELFIISEDIIKKIKDRYQVFDKETGLLRDIRYSDICIITDRNKYLDKYKKILEYNGIPSTLYMDEILTNDTVILVLKNLISLVDYVNRRQYDDKFRYLFTSVARSFLFEYSDDLIYNINLNKKYLFDNIVKMCMNIDINEPLELVINNIMNDFSVYEKITYLNDIDKSLVRISNLIDVANSLGNIGYGLSEFVKYIDEVIELGLPVKYSLNTSNGDSVKIMNIHKSKGLEFSLCYFTGMHNKFTIKEISNKMLVSDKYGIILPYLCDGDVKDTIIKDLYVDEYLKEEVSEKIRLFYVALTRCREKMIIVTSLDNDRNGYFKLVPYIDRIKYRSFLDILNSLGVIDKYVTDKSANYTHQYDFKKLLNLDFDNVDKKIENRNIDINYEKVDKKHFSKESNVIQDISDIKAMEYGTKVHEILEFSDFRNGNNKYVINLLKQVDNNFINVYREYEFTYNNNGSIYNGVIDLMLEYDNYINIIDYKLKNVSDLAYINQLKGYRDYIGSITNKDINLYLYSILDDKLLRLDV